MLIVSVLFSMIYSIPHKCKPNVEPNVEQRDYYWNGSCNVGGVYSVNEFGANICEYQGDTCPIVKYFSYSGGETGVELCCNNNSECNYAAVKNYCHPDLKRCVDGSYFGCSEKEGQLFDSCK